MAVATAATKESKGSEVLAEAEATPLSAAAKARACKVGPDTVLVGKLSINQWTGLGMLIMKATAGMNEAEREGLKEAAGKGVSGDLAGVMALLNEDTIADIYGLAVDRSRSFIKEHFDLLEMLEVFDATMEHNDPKMIWAGFQRMAHRWSPPSSTS